MSSHRVAVVVPPSFALFELSVAIEVFATPRQGLPEDWYDVRVCAAHPGLARAQGNVFTAMIEHGVEAIDDADTVIVPEAASLAEPADEEVLQALRRAYVRGARLVSYCAGAFVLAAAGVLDGRPATTHWKYAGRLVRDYPLVRVQPDVLYIDDGQVLTSAGTAAGIDLSLHIVRSDHGAQVAREVARHMVVPPHRDGGQAQFVMSPVPEAGVAQGGVHQVMAHVSRHLEEDFSLSDMAALAYMSTRNFSRRFRDVAGTTPGQWLLNQRLTRARELLEETDEPIEKIAEMAGFGSAVTMRQRFVQTLRTSPAMYRRAFRDAGQQPAGIAS